MSDSNFRLEPTHHIESMLRGIATSGLAGTSSDIIQAIALHVWYGEELYDTKSFGETHHREMVFLVHRLSYYAVVPTTRKRALLDSVRNAGGQWSDMAEPVLEAAFDPYIAQLQSLQTRHFALSFDGKVTFTFDPKK
jgi:hypothetical protein